jgi:chromosome segregation ATPase
VVTELAEEIAGWERIKGALNEIGACHAETMSFFTDVFDQLESLYGSLLDRERQAVPSAEARADNGLAEQSAEDGRWDALRREFAADCEQLRRAQEGMGEKIDRLTAVADDLAARRDEFETVRSEIARHNEEMAALRSQMQAAQQDVEASLKNKMLDLDQQQSLLEKDRALMEAGLESVCSRATEMGELLDEHKRVAAEQESNWVEEIQQMRSMLESLANHAEEDKRQIEEEQHRAEQDKRQAMQERRQTDYERRAADSSVPKAPVGVAGVAMADPVLESVLAQFEILQQDRHSRRSDSSQYPSRSQ